MSLLHDAARSGDMAMLRQALADNPNVNETDNDLLTPLHWACARGHHGVARSLLDAGALVNCPDRSGRTPLNYAVDGRHLVIEQLLRSVGAGEAGSSARRSGGVRDGDKHRPASPARSGSFGYSRETVYALADSIYSAAIAFTAMEVILGIVVGFVLGLLYGEGDRTYALIGAALIGTGAGIAGWLQTLFARAMAQLMLTLVNIEINTAMNRERVSSKVPSERP